MPIGYKIRKDGLMKKFIKVLAVFSVISLILISFTAQVYAADTVVVNNYSENFSATRATDSDINVNVRFSDGITPGIQGKLISNTTYVALRSFLNSIGGFNISWNQKYKIATAVSDKFNVSVQIDKYELIVNDSDIATNAKNLLINNTTYVPLRPLAEAFGFDVKWNGSTKTVTLAKIIQNDNFEDEENFGTYKNYTARADAYYDYEDLYWLSRIISAESRGESIEGKLAVGSVVMNRVDHKNYPSSIKGVVFDDKYAIQFTPVSNGSIYYEPTDESVFAAKIILEGYRIDKSVIYFVDTKVSPNSWVELNNDFVFKIGCHSFFK